MSFAAKFRSILLSEPLRSASLKANGSGWSCNYDCLLYTDSIDSVTNFLQGWRFKPSPQSPHTLKHGFLLRLQTFHLLNPLYMDDSFLLERLDRTYVVYFPPAHFSSLQNVNNLVNFVLTKFGVPSTDRDSLVRLIYSFGRCHEESSDAALVPMYLDFNITTVLRNETEAVDWMCGGTMNSVIVRTLRATHEAILELKKTSFNGSSSKTENCMVCLEGFVDGERVSRMPCMHEYHHDCIAEWLRSNHRCPICRFPMPWVHAISDSASFDESDEVY